MLIVSTAGVFRSKNEIDGGVQLLQELGVTCNSPDRFFVTFRHPTGSFAPLPVGTPRTSIRGSMGWGNVPLGRGLLGVV